MKYRSFSFMLTCNYRVYELPWKDGFKFAKLQICENRFAPRGSKLVSNISYKMILKFNLFINLKN